MKITMNMTPSCGHYHETTTAYVPCMKKLAFRSGARLKIQTTQVGPMTSSTSLHLLTEAVEPDVIADLKKIREPKGLAQAIINECREAQKRFYRPVLGWNSTLDPGLLRELDDFSDPVLAFNACIEVSESLMRRYPGLLSVTGTELVNDHPSKNPLQLHHHSANIVLTDLRTRGDNATVIDFTMSQLHPELSFPWVGPRREWVSLVNRTPSPTPALKRELTLV